MLTRKMYSPLKSKGGKEKKHKNRLLVIMTRIIANFVYLKVKLKKFKKEFRVQVRKYDKLDKPPVKNFLSDNYTHKLHMCVVVKLEETTNSGSLLLCLLFSQVRIATMIKFFFAVTTYNQERSKSGHGSSKIV